MGDNGVSGCSCVVGTREPEMGRIAVIFMARWPYQRSWHVHLILNFCGQDRSDRVIRLVAREPKGEVIAVAPPGPYLHFESTPTMEAVGSSLPHFAL
jgi:hypothetical protein